MGRKTKWNILGFAGLLVFLIGFINGCGLLPEEEEVLAPPLVKPEPEEYELYEVKRKDITKFVEGTGTLIPANEVQLCFKESGKRIKSINVTYGQQVKKGTVVAQVDTGDLETRIKLQEYALKKAELFYSKLKKQGADIYDREMARIDVLSAKVMLDSLKREYEQSKLIAPMDGVVTFVDNLKEGDPVEAFKPVIIIADPRKLQVYYQSSSTSQVKTGMKAYITYGGQKYEGKVVLSPDNVPLDSYEKLKNVIIIEVENLPEDAKMGDFVELSIPIESKKNTIVIPKRGLRKFMGECTVQIMDGNSKKEVNVEVGIETATEVEILSGLEEGQMVILK